MTTDKYEDSAGDGGNSARLLWNALVSQQTQWVAEALRFDSWEAWCACAMQADIDGDTKLAAACWRAARRKEDHAG